MTSLARDGESEAVVDVFRECLAWLLTADAETLSADQLTIRAYIQELIASGRSE